MLLAFKQNAFANRPDIMRHSVNVIRDAGFHGIGLVFDKPYLWLDAFSAKNTKDIRAILDRSGLSVADVSTCTASGYDRPDDDFTPPGQRFGPSFTSDDAEERRCRTEHTKRVIDFAVALGCYNVDTSTGYQPAGADHATAWKRTRDCLCRICEYAEERGVSLNIEYEPGEFGPGGLFVGSATSALAMINDVGSTALGINLDVGHSYVCAEDVPATIRMADDRVRVVEFEDIKSYKDERGIWRRRHYHLVPGEGEMDYLPIFEALKEIGFSGPVIVELYSLFDKNPEEACQKTYMYLAEHFSEYFTQ